jgi:DNA-binding transcriptional regulator LsrR (DeoR family)
MKRKDIDIDKLVLLLKNHTKREIAIYFQVSETTINRHLKKLKMTRPGYGRGKIKPNMAREIRKLYNQDKYTQVALAKSFGISRKSVNEIVNFKSHIDDGDMGTKGSAEVTIIFNVEASIEKKRCLSEIKTGQHIDYKDQIH